MPSPCDNIGLRLQRLMTEDDYTRAQLPSRLSVLAARSSRRSSQIST